MRCCCGIRIPKKLISFPRMVNVRGKESTGSLGRKVFQGQLWHRSSSVLAVLDSCHQAMSCVPCPAPMAQLWWEFQACPSCQAQTHHGLPSSALPTLLLSWQLGEVLGLWACSGECSSPLNPGGAQLLVAG